MDREGYQEPTKTEGRKLEWRLSSFVPCFVSGYFKLYVFWPDKSTKHQYELFTIWRKEGRFFNRLNGSSLFWFDSEIIEARQVRFERSKKRNSSYDGKKLIYNDLF